MKHVRVLCQGFLEQPYMGSHVHTRTMTTEENVPGHPVGPLGVIMLINVTGTLPEPYGTGIHLTMAAPRSVIGVFMRLDAQPPAQGTDVPHRIASRR